MRDKLEYLVDKYTKISTYSDILYDYVNDETFIDNINVSLLIDEINMGEDFVLISLFRNIEIEFEEENLTEYKLLLEGLDNLEVSNIVDNTYEDYRNVLVIMAKDYRIIILELAYRVVLMRKFKKSEFEDKKQFAQISLYIYAPIAHRLGLGQIKTELEELSLYFIDLKSFKHIVNTLNAKKDKRNSSLNQMIDEITSIASESTSKYDVFGRSKSIYSIYNKTIKQGKPVESIFDLQGIRVICDTKAECYLMLGLIHELYTPVSGRFKDYIALKKPNLYQSLHTAITNSEGEIFEIQIRTFEMDDIAERGIAAHWIYKEGGNANLNDIEEQLHLFRDLIGTSQEQTKELGLKIFESSIYTFTPNKKIIHLPKDANVIDFAYRIHSNVAEQMVGALVNGKIQAFETPLVNGDTVEILTRKGAKSPNLEWLDFAKTTHAQKKIRAYLKKQVELADLEFIIRGEELFETYLRKLNINPSFLDDEKNRASLMRYFSQKRLNTLFMKLASKDITYKDMENYFAKPKQKEVKLVTTKEELNQEAVIVSGAEGIKKVIASCCSPIPGDDITGCIVTGSGIKIHRSNCPNVEGQNMITASWNTYGNVASKYEVDLLCFFEERDNLLTEIIAIFTKQGLGIKHIDSKVHCDIVKTKITTVVKDAEQLHRLILNIESLKGVVEVKRLIK